MSAQPPAAGKSPATPAHKGTDLGAALTGLIVGAVVIFALMFGIVKLTAASKSSHAAEAKTAPQR